MAPGRRVALLPLPLLALVVAAGASVGAVFAERLGTGWIAALPAAAVTGAASYVLHRLLPRVGARAYDAWPSTYDSSYGAALEWRPPAARAVCGLAMAATMGAVLAVLIPAGVDEGSAILVGLAVGFPVWFEVDARLALRARAKGAEEELRVGYAAEHPPPSASAGDTIATRRALAIAQALATFAAAVGCVAYALFGDDTYGRLVTLVAAAAFAYSGVAYARWARIRTFLRADGDGIDLVESGMVAWESVTGVYVTDEHRRRHLTVWRDESADVKAPLWLAAASTEDVLGLIRSQSDVEVEIELG